MKNYKSTLYGAVAYCVFIGIAYVALSVVGLLSRWEVIKSEGGPVVYMLYLMYFHVGTEFRWDIMGFPNDPNIIIPENRDAVSHMFVFLIVYLGLHAALIVTSLYALCGVNNSCLGRRSFPVFFVPWLVILVAVIILDVLATVYYIIDTVNLTSVDGLIDILQVNDAARPSLKQISAHHRYLPPIIILITTAKLFLLLILNIVWIVAITKAGWSASTYHKYLDETRRNYENTMAGVNPAFEGLRDDIVAQKQHERQMEFLSDQSSVQELNATSSSTQTATAPPQEEPAETRYKDTTQVQGYVYPYQMSRNDKREAPQPPQQHTSTEITEEEPHGFKIKRPTTLVIPERQQRTQQNQQIQNYPHHYNQYPQQQQHQQQQPHYNAKQNNADREIDNRLNRYQETSGTAIKTIEPIKYDDTISEQQQLPERVLVLPPISESNRASLKPIPPPKPQHNRYSVQPPERSPVLYRPNAQRTNSARVDRTSSNVKAPDELRSQLPWSYFKPPNEAPKKAFSHLEENEDIPAVPVPDYTLHYGKKARGNLNDSEDNSSRYQRY